MVRMVGMTVSYKMTFEFECMNFGLVNTRLVSLSLRKNIWACKATKACKWNFEKNFESIDLIFFSYHKILREKKNAWIFLKKRSNWPYRNSYSQILDAEAHITTINITMPTIMIAMIHACTKHPTITLQSPTFIYISPLPPPNYCKILESQASSPLLTQ